MVRALLAALLVALVVVAPVARADIPVRVRVIKGSRHGPAAFDPKLSDLKKQLSRLSYVRWDQVDQQDIPMAPGKTVFVTLPDGEHMGLTLLEARGDTVTFEVALAHRNTQSRLTIEKDKRIVHQVSGEKSGVAYFATIHPWP